MRFIALLLSLLIALPAQGAGPIIWYGSNSKDLTSDGLITPQLTLPDGSSDELIVKAPASLVAPWTLTLPQDAGTADYVMITDGSGVTSWVDAASVVQGSADTFAGFDASGDLTSVPGWNYDPSVFNGVTVDNTIVPVDNVSGALNTYRASVDPAATVTNTNWIQTQHEMNIGTGNGADMADVVGFQANVNSRMDSGVDNVSVIQANIDFGDNDAVAAGNLNAFVSNIDIDDQATVVGLNSIYSNVNSAAGSEITGMTHLAMGGNIDTITGGFNGVTVNPNIVAVNNVTGYYLGGTWTTVGSSITGAQLSPVVTDEMTNTYNGFLNSPNLGDINGAQAFADFAQVDNNQTNSYQSVLLAPNITASNSYTAVSNAATLGTIENAVGFNDTPSITSVENYMAMNVGGTITTATDGWNGLNIGVNVTGDGTGYANGININMSGVTNFSTGQVYAINATGNAQINGSFNAFQGIGPVDGGGNPQSSHGAITGVSVPANSTTANADTIGLNTAMLIDLGANSTTTSGPFGLGFAALAFPAVLTTHSGASMDYINGAVFAVSLDPASDGGTVDNLNLARTTAIPQGGTHTITNLRGYYANLPYGDPGTNSWGLYAEDFPQNFVEGNFKFGGTPGSSDTTTERVQVEGNVLLQNATGSQPQLKLAEDPDNGTNTTTIQAAASISDYTLTLPVDDGAAGEVLTTDGSGVLSWAAAATLPVDLTTDVTGVLPIANGGTNASTQQTAINSLAGAVTDNRVLRGDGTDVALGQIDDPSFFTTGALATSSAGGTVEPYSTNGVVYAGIYTPTISATTNLDANPTVTDWHFSRVGNIVSVSGEFTANPTAGAPTQTTFTFSLPVAPTGNFGNTYELSGSLTWSPAAAILNNAGEVIASTGATTGQAIWATNGTNNRRGHIAFTYKVAP
jgi:hypothetical protein